MAILDDSLEFCDATSLNTGAANTYNIGDVLDMVTARDYGNGETIYFVVRCSTGITTGGGAGTVAFQLVSDGTDTIATNGTQTIHATSKPWATSGTAIAVGTILFCIALPSEGAVYERYLAVQQVTGTTALNAGAVNAYLTKDASVIKAYQDYVSGNQWSGIG